MERVFLLSPAHSGGKRAAMLMRPGANFELARQVRIGAASLGDVFTFCSGLYFRGKIAYARRFATPPRGIDGAYIISASRGLVSTELRVGLKELKAFAAVQVHSREPLFTEPLRETAISPAAGGSFQVVL